MPIKFRCQKCRQFLGIARAQAGHVVDCPTCGRATRVPNLDGSREPLPQQPAIGKVDTSLLNALDQLADLGKDEPAASEEQKSPSSPPLDSDKVPPVKLAEPIAVQALGASAVIDPPDVDEAKEPPDSRPLPNADAGVPAASRDVLKNLAATAPPRVADTNDKSRVSGAMVSAVILGGALLFAAGWLFGRMGSGPSQPVGLQEGNGIDEIVGGEEITAALNGLRGRVTYRKSESECLPDRGSRVLAWPVGFSPDAPWSSGGFRAGDSDELTHSATDKLKAAGGNLAVVDDAGYFELEVASGGDFEILILSRFGGAEIDGQGVSPAELARLKICFAEPRKLVGQTQFRLIRMKYRGQGVQLLDHVFEVVE